MMRGLLFVCPNESDTQTGVVLTTSHGKQELARRFDQEARA